MVRLSDDLNVSNAGSEAVPKGPADIEAISFSDLAVVIGLPVLLAVSWLLPKRLWYGFCRAVAPLTMRMIASDSRALCAIMRRTLGGQGTSLSPDAILHELANEHLLSLLQLLRDYLPGGWNPEIHADGLSHVEAALESGRGAILWVGFTVHADLVAKMAFCRAGLRVHHLSRASHGFSATRFGIRFLNRIQTIIENRYLGERVMLDPGGARSALDALAEHLARNGVVSLTARREAKQPVRVPFLDGSLLLAPGAIVLAMKTGAELLPAFAFRDATGSLRVTIGPRLHLPTDMARTEAVNHVARQYASILEPFVLENPGQWKGWLQL